MGAGMDNDPAAVSGQLWWPLRGREGKTGPKEPFGPSLHPEAHLLARAPPALAPLGLSYALKSHLTPEHFRNFPSL